MQILIAEDDAVSRFILQATIESLGHTCLVAEDGLAAWELYEARGADVLISDWMMPGLSGLELCQRVRAREGTASVTAGAEAQPEIGSYTYFIFLTTLFELKLHIILLAISVVIFDGLLHQRPQSQRLHIKIHLAGFYFIYVQDVAHQAHQPLGVVVGNINQ